MAEVGYLYLTDVTDGGKWVKGDCEETKWKDWIQVQALEHTVSLGTDPQTGQTTTEATYSPFAITKPMDEASPLIHLALSKKHEVKVKIQFSRARRGKPEIWYEITLDDARIVSVRTFKPPAYEGATVPDLEYVEFSYRRITWNHLIENKMAYFDWREKSEK